VTGTYGLVAIHQDQPTRWSARGRGTRWARIGPHEHFLASDVSAWRAYADVAPLRDFDW